MTTIITIVVINNNGNTNINSNNVWGPGNYNISDSTEHPYNRTDLGASKTRGAQGRVWEKSTDLTYGWLSKLGSLLGVPIVARHLLFRVPRKGP